jgi:hypothetical protein
LVIDVPVDLKQPWEQSLRRMQPRTSDRFGRLNTTRAVVLGSGLSRASSG